MTKELVISVKKLKYKYKVETTENKYYFSEETILKYSIFKDREFDEAELKEIVFEEEKNNLINKAINYLSYQARSINEIRKYLIKNECNEAVLEDIVEKIISLGYLDDEALGVSLLDYSKRTLKGPRFLENKLKEKMLEEDLIKRLTKEYTLDAEEAVVNELFFKIGARYSKYPLRKQKELIYAKLVRDGFSSEVINSLLARAEFIDQSNDTLDNEFRKLINKFMTEDGLDSSSKQKIIQRLLAKGYDYSLIKAKFESLN